MMKEAVLPGMISYPSLLYVYLYFLATYLSSLSVKKKEQRTKLKRNASSTFSTFAIIQRAPHARAV